MAKFCGDDCIAICDFCKHYKDEYRDINGLDQFVGEGICGIDNHETDACGGYKCDGFECFRIKE